MRRTPVATTRRPPVASLRHLTVIALIVVLAMHVSSTASLAQQAPVGLGTADSFAVLAGSTITNTGSSTVTGDIGLHPGTEYTGSADVTHDGSEHLTDDVAEQAKVDLVTAYDDAAGRTPVTTVATELGGQTLLGGVYDSEAGTFEITGTLTLDAEGDPDTVWVFQTDSTLITATDSDFDLINGADACNVFWQVGSSATLGTDSEFVGTIMALESITLTTGATVEGRVLARNGAVTLDTNTITNEACAPPEEEDDAPPEDDDVTEPDDDDATPPAVQPPTRIDAGAGGTAPPASRPGLLLLLAVGVVGTAAVLLRRVKGSA